MTQFKRHAHPIAYYLTLALLLFLFIISIYQITILTLWNIILGVIFAISAFTCLLGLIFANAAFIFPTFVLFCCWLLFNVIFMIVAFVYGEIVTGILEWIWIVLAVLGIIATWFLSKSIGTRPAVYSSPL